MSAKSALKAAKAAIDGKKWDEARSQAHAMLEKDPNNYFANLFLGRANCGLGKFEEAAQAYMDAVRIKPDDSQAWLGLRTMYEGMGSAKVDENIEVGLKLSKIFIDLDDAHRSQTAIDKLVDHARNHGTSLQYANALATQLPSSPVYSFLEGRLPAPSKVYTRIAEIYEAHEAATIKQLIDERRLRLGATLEKTTSSVKREVYTASPLERVYEELINWTNDDDLRREYEEKLLQRAYDTLLVLPVGEKKAKRDKVMRLAHDMVVIKHPYLLAWNIELEWRCGLDVEAY